MTERFDAGEHRRRNGLPDVPNVLLLAPSRSPVEAETCAELLASGQADDAAALRIEFGSSSLDEPADWPANAERRPRSFKVITIGQRAERSDDPDRRTSSIDATVEHVDDPAGLDEVGVLTSETLERWTDAYDHVGLCLDSLSALQRHVGIDETYYFLHVLSRHVSRLGVRAHYHLDPSEHDLEAAYTYETLTGGIVATGDVEIVPEY